MQSVKIAFFFDSSGSLAEYGRPHLLQYLLSLTSGIVSRYSKSLECQYFAWSEDVIEIKPGHVFSPKGRAGLLVLAQKIAALETQEAVGAFLIFTDDGQIDQLLYKKEYAQILSGGSAPILAALIGTGVPSSLQMLTRNAESFPADSLPIYLRSFLLGLEEAGSV